MPGFKGLGCGRRPAALTVTGRWGQPSPSDGFCEPRLQAVGSSSSSGAEEEESEREQGGRGQGGSAQVRAFCEMKYGGAFWLVGLRLVFLGVLFFCGDF